MTLLTVTCPCCNAEVTFAVTNIGAIPAHPTITMAGGALPPPKFVNPDPVPPPVEPPPKVEEVPT